MGASFDPGLASEAIITLLTADLPAKFDALDTAYADSITLADITDYYRAAPGQIDTFPAIAIYANGPQTPEGQYSGWEMRMHRLELRIWQEAMQATSAMLPVEVMQKRLERSVRGIEEVLHTGRRLTVTGARSASINNIGPSDFLPFSDPVEGDVSRVIRAARIPIAVLVT